MLVACESKPAVVPEAGPAATALPASAPAASAPSASAPAATAGAQCSAAADCHATNPCGVYGPNDCGPLAQPTPPITQGCPNAIATHHCACVAGRCAGVHD